MDQSGQLRRVFTQLDEPHLLHTLESLDTVRALHQTVVALRKALENSQLEIQKLKQQINVQNDINEAKVYHTEQRQVKFCGTDKIFDEKEKLEKSIFLSKSKSKLDDNTFKEPPIKLKSDSRLNNRNCIKKKPNIDYLNRNEPQVSQINNPEINITYPTGKKANNQQQITTQTSTMSSSKIGVKIRVSSNIQLDSSSSELDSARSEKDEVKSKTDETEKNILPISQITDNRTENDNKTDNRESTSSNLYLDVDNISIASMSEGDNSVFTEGAITPVETNDKLPVNEKSEKSETVDTQTKLDVTSARESTTSEHHEEVDDIELIFSSDDNKEIIQEDLVSISDYEPWQLAGASGTPVLVKYSPLPSDHSLQHEDSHEENSNKSSNNHEEKQTPKRKSEDSSDELSLEKLNHSLDFSEKSSRFNNENSVEEVRTEDCDVVPRDESFDTFDQGTDYGHMGQKWKNFNILVETDISKCGILEENVIDLGRRNTCPNPPAYRPIIQSPLARQQTRRCPLAVKFSRSPRSQYQKTRPILMESNRNGPKRSSSAQTEISALPEYWRSESHLSGGYYDGFYTLPSKFVPPQTPTYRKFPLRPSDKTQEARRVLLSDISFTSMVPELSRSADHLCHDDEGQNICDNKSMGYYKGNLLKTPESFAGVTPSASMMSPGVSQWTVNDNSYTQTTQTEYWGNNRGDSFDSCKSYSMGSKYSTDLNRHHRSRSVPSIRCAICKQMHYASGMRTSESMHYTPRVSFQEPTKHAIRGSLPDLRHDCNCPRRYGGPSLYKIHGDSEGSTDSLIDEADDFLKRSVEGTMGSGPIDYRGSFPTNQKKAVNTNRRCSENDIQRDYIPSKQALPFLPKSPKCLKPGYLAKVISKNGRVVIGRVRYIGPLANTGSQTDVEVYIGLQLPNKFGDCDGSIDGRKFFDCEPLQGIFVPFKKIVMAWTS